MTDRSTPAPPPRSVRPALDVGALLLAGAAAVLVAAGLLARYLAYRRELADPGIAPPAWMALFDVNAEANVPTWFTVAVLVAGGGAALGVAALSWSRRRRAGRFFLGLAVLLLAMSLDEVASIHERLQGLGESLAGGSAVHFAWVLPGSLVAVAVVLSLVLGARAIPSGVRRRLLVGLAVFFAGALVVETIGGQVLAAHGDRAAYLLVTSAEELLEMLGVVLLLRAVLSAVVVAPTADHGWVLRPAGAA